MFAIVYILDNVPRLHSHSVMIASKRVEEQIACLRFFHHGSVKHERHFVFLVGKEGQWSDCALAEAFVCSKKRCGGVGWGERNKNERERDRQRQRQRHTQRERETETETETERDRVTESDRERERVCVCVCVCDREREMNTTTLLTIVDEYN